MFVVGGLRGFVRYVERGERVAFFGIFFVVYTSLKGIDCFRVVYRGFWGYIGRRARVRG